jgi:CBS domain containing-hemolysin-like protein
MALPLWLQTTLAFAGLLAGLVAAAVYAGLETGVYVLNRVRLELRAAQGDRAAARLARALARMREMLAALLVGNGAAAYLVTLSVVALLKLAGVPRVGLYTMLVAGPLLFTLGQVLPKNLFRVAGETLTYALSGVVTATMQAARWTGISPVLMLLGRAILWLPPGARTDWAGADPRQRIATMLAEGHAQGVLTPIQSHIANRVVSLRSTRIREVMVPLARVAGIPIGCSRERFWRALAGLRHSRLTVWRDRPSNIVGILNVYDVLFDEDPNARPADHVMEPIRLLDQLSISQAMVTLQRAHQSMGLVVNAMDRLVGIVTVQDLIEEIVGELEEL